jgi:hypothetical protein
MITLRSIPIDVTLTAAAQDIQANIQMPEFSGELLDARARFGFDGLTNTFAGANNVYIHLWQIYNQETPAYETIIDISANTWPASGAEVRRTGEFYFRDAMPSVPITPFFKSAAATPLKITDVVTTAGFNNIILHNFYFEVDLFFR